MCEGFRRRKICIVIAFVWLISAIIGSTQIILELVQRDEGIDDRNEVDETKYNNSHPRCELRLKPFYALGSSMCSFVIPAAMMVLLYTRLYLFARKHAKIMRIQVQQAANFAVTLNACEGIRNNTNVGFFYDRIFAMCRCCHRNDPIVLERIKSKNVSSKLCITDQKARSNLILEMKI
uniref:G_PROTEIN_RECEP_F1_2 domain-containing protein n=1 Tax=Loa loa TaxID=7209 RepID=A0A1I7V5E4_LOALO